MCNKDVPHSKKGQCESWATKNQYMNEINLSKEMICSSMFHKEHGGSAECFCLIQAA